MLGLDAVSLSDGRASNNFVGANKPVVESFQLRLCLLFTDNTFDSLGS